MKRFTSSFARPRRIRTFLILFALALTLPLLGLASFAFNRLAEVEREKIEGRVLQVARGLVADVDRELERAMVTLETLASSEALLRGDFAAFHQQAGRALNRERAGILVLDLDLQQMMNTRAAFGTRLPTTRDPKTARLVIETKQRQVSDLFEGRVSGGPVVNVEVPVFVDEAVRYILVMALDASHFERLLQAQGLEPHWITGITDNNGIILARSERHGDFVGKPLPKELLEQSRAAQGVFRATNVAGVEILRATLKSQLAGWLVSATVPVSYVESTRKVGEIFVLAMIVTALGLGGLLAITFGRFMAMPLEAATQAAAQVGHGNRVEPLQSPLVEANTLSRTLAEASLELQRRQEHATFLMRELAHRSKNQLAVVRGMALQTGRQAATVDQFVRQLSQRVQGLAESQDVMVRQNWQGAFLRDLVAAHLNLFGATGRAQIEGPALFLNANAVQNIGFALHELATNASKHGALTGGGRIRVTWQGPGADGHIRLEWLETGGPAVETPSRRGFGHQVIMELVPGALRGKAVLDFTADGVRWQLDMPASHVTGNASDAIE